MDTDKEKAVRKQLRIDFIASLVTGSILLAMGIFGIVVCKYFPVFGAEIGFPLSFGEKSGLPLIDLFAHFVESGFVLMILLIYGVFPAIFGFAILSRSIFMKLLKSTDYSLSTKMSGMNLCIVIANIIFTIGFFELGIYPKIYVIVNSLLAAAMIIILIKRPESVIKNFFLRKKCGETEDIMKISALFKSIVDSDIAPIVICETDHEIVYMNPAAVERYAKRGGAELVGKSLLDCHNADSNKKIKSIVEWFGESPENNRVFTFHNPKENKDVYMIALRDENGGLIGYYEKHEYRTPESDLSH